MERQLFDVVEGETDRRADAYNAVAPTEETEAVVAAPIRRPVGRPRKVEAVSPPILSSTKPNGEAQAFTRIISETTAQARLRNRNKPLDDEQEPVQWRVKG